MGSRFVVATGAVLALCITSWPVFADDSIDDVLARARAAEEKGDWAGAVGAYDRAIRIDAGRAALYQRRGEAHFRLGRIDQTIADFDGFLKRSPGREPHHWQRGIAYYYAGRFADGRKQFESHQTVNPDDVENAAWHFACVARADGAATARAALLPIAYDARVPMMRIYAMFAGRAAPQDVLAAARAGNPPPRELSERLFYAHLYVGLYLEATGETEKSREHIELAARDAPAHYMGAVALVHAKRLGEARRATRPANDPKGGPGK